MLDRTTAISSVLLALVAVLPATGGSPSLCPAACAGSRQCSNLPMFPAAGSGTQGFLRVINHSRVEDYVDIIARDEDGVSHTVYMLVGSSETAHLNSDDLEFGNPNKNLFQGSGGPGTDGWGPFEGTGSGSGDWHLHITSLSEFEVLAYIRTADGFLTAMSDCAPRREDGAHHVVTFNPGKNTNQVSLLRLVNPAFIADQVAHVTVRGIDDAGSASAEAVELSLDAGEARTISALELELGGPGLRGSLGRGKGKWQLVVENSFDASPTDPRGFPPTRKEDATIPVMSLLRSPTGHLTNLSTAPVNQRAGKHVVPLFPAVDDVEQRQGFVRVINRSNRAGSMSVDAWDDAGARYGPITLRLGANEVAHFNSNDLEGGNASKGISEGTGSGDGHWRLALSSELDIEVLAYIRMPDGFLTAMHGLLPPAGDRYQAVTFNPGSNPSQVSALRLVNAGRAEAEVTITGWDDLSESPGGSVVVRVPAHQTRTLSSSELESGSGLMGSLGDGHGKWRLSVRTSGTIDAMSLLASPTGHLTNLSTAPDRYPFRDKFAGSRLATVVDDNVALMRVAFDLALEAAGELHVLASEFYKWFEDEFDFVLFVSNLHSPWESDTWYSGLFSPAMNDVEGTGRSIFYSDAFGSAGRLRGAIHLVWRGALLYGPTLHELFHAWANHAVPSSHSSHWGFSSADGQLGGFNRDNLQSLGDGRYVAGMFGRIWNGSRKRYSPIELYLAGYIGPEEVPDLWVAPDGQWSLDAAGRVTTHDGQHVFEADEVVDLTIEDIVADHGRRLPNHLEAQHDFRAGVVLLVDERRPVLARALARLSRDVSIFEYAGDHRLSPAWDHSMPPVTNYYEATGGRGTIALGALASELKGQAGVAYLPAPFGQPPPVDFHTHGPDGRVHRVVPRQSAGVHSEKVR